MWEYGFVFDAGRHFVSIRGESQPTLETTNEGAVYVRQRHTVKEDKVDEFKWNQRPILSIEDPFEVDYDVAHVLREGTYRNIKREFAVRSACLFACLLVDTSKGALGSHHACLAFCFFLLSPPPTTTTTTNSAPTLF